MGCCNGKDDKAEDDKKDDFGPEEFEKERLHISQGETQIDVKNANLHEIEAQCIVTVIDNKGNGGGSDIIKHVWD